MNDPLIQYGSWSSNEPDNDDEGGGGPSLSHGYLSSDKVLVGGREHI